MMNFSMMNFGEKFRRGKKNSSVTIALQLRFAILNPSSSTYSIILINFIISSYEFYLFPSSSYALDPTTTIFLSDISKLNSLIS